MEKELLEHPKDLSNILNVLKDAKKALIKSDSMKLNHLSNQTIHSATVHQDSINIIVAVLIYSISKILTRKNYQNLNGWSQFYKTLQQNLDLMIKSAQKNDSEQLILHAGKIRNSLNTLDIDLKSYISDIFRKAEINKAFKLYEHGLSSEQTAKLLGISLWDMASYIGQSSITEAKVKTTINEEQRIKLIQDFLK